MTKIILADSNEEYINTLKIRFATEFFEKIEIETITEKSYFEEAFSMPVQANVLIISNEWFDERIKRHPIENIFVLNDNKLSESTSFLGVSSVYKYLDIFDIFSEIVGKCKECFNFAEEQKETKVIVVTSAVGAVGKTAIAMGLCAAFEKSNRKALYIDAEELQTFHYLLNYKECIMRNDVYSGLLHKDDGVYEELKKEIRKELFYYIPPFKASLLSLGIEKEVFLNLVERIINEKDYDYIVVDTDSSFDLEKMKFIDVADRVVVVVTNEEKACFATNIMLDNIANVGTEKFVIVSNEIASLESNYLTGVKLPVKETIERIEDSAKIQPNEFCSNKGIQRLLVQVL
ncbi:MAG: hypothetical protein E7242_03725 [Lachnospiraceae bacterium]|nr:hypothetical protein [Lachnospiraceae bacterium]